jgi:hypothetical protein
MDQPLSEWLSEGELGKFSTLGPAKDTACIGYLLVMQEWLPPQQPALTGDAPWKRQKPVWIADSRIRIIFSRILADSLENPSAV